MLWLSIVDFSEEITNDSLLSLIASHFPSYWRDLDVGSIQRGVEKKKYRTAIENHCADQQLWSKIEWYGNVASKSDPEKDWESYLSATFAGSRDLTICSTSSDFSTERLIQFVCAASELGSLGYGYGGDWDAEGLTYYIAGITYGLPKSLEEKRRADELSRWFSERLPIANSPAKKRYLKGMYRGAYEINVLNRSQVDDGAQKSLQLRELNGSQLGTLSYCENGTFLWTLAGSDLTAAEQLLLDKQLII
jgi:hypothetical protein